MKTCRCQCVPLSISPANHSVEQHASTRQPFGVAFNVHRRPIAVLVTERKNRDGSISDQGAESAVTNVSYRSDVGACDLAEARRSNPFDNETAPALRWCRGQMTVVNRETFELTRRGRVPDGCEVRYFDW